MAYEQLNYTFETVAIPEKIRSFIDEADRRCDAFYDAQLNKRFPRYVPSEPEQVFAALKHLTDANLPLGKNFIEWGSGFGVATGIASLLGYDATGIEIEETLVEMAESLIKDRAIDAEFLATSFVPEGYLLYEAVSGYDLVPDDSFGNRPDGNPRYEGMDIDLNEVDLFFAYPWPGEQEMTLKLFDAVAGEGALLVAYFGDRDLCIYRKLDD
jgi:hypothetical protein